MFTNRVKVAQNLSLLGISALARGLKDVIYLNVGEPDYSTPKHIIEAAYEAMKKGYTHYPPDEGYPELREAVAEYYNRRYGTDYEYKNVLITTGSTQAIFAAIMTFIDRGDEVILPDPWYPGYIRSVQMVEGKVKTVKQDENNHYNLDIDNLNEQISEKTKALIIINPNNPTGSVLDKQTMKGIVDIVEDNKIILIADEIYERFVFEGEFRSFSQFPEISDKTIIVNGFSKTYAMTGWRIGYAIAPLEIIEEMKKVTIASTLSASSFAQFGALAALEGPNEPVKKMIQDYKERRDTLVEGVHRIKKFKLVKPRGAFYAFINTEEINMNEEELVKYLVKEAKVLTSPGYPFFGPSGKKHIRIAYTVDREKVKEAVERIRKAIEKI
ncbi:MAG: pyridoxal phosphate-dependent aminotransferase [Candidatus Njordarchaeia archaeon]